MSYSKGMAEDYNKRQSYLLLVVQFTCIWSGKLSFQISTALAAKNNKHSCFWQVGSGQRSLLLKEKKIIILIKNLSLISFL